MRKSALIIALRQHASNRREALALVEEVYPRRAAIDAVAWLKRRLAGHSVKSATLIAQAEAAGISKATLYRASRALHVKTERRGFGDSKRAYWRLP